MLKPFKHSRTQAEKINARSSPFFGRENYTSFFQAKLTVNQPGDVHEKEADRVADQVMRMEKGDTPVVNRKETTATTGGFSAPPIVGQVLSSGGGQPLDAGTRQFMESRFGQDFSQVRIHTDGKGAESASAIQARAYTSGRDIVFAKGEYQPGTEGGKRLLAHELVHVGQQNASGDGKSIQRDEKLTQVWRVGPFDAWKAKKDADTALAAASNSGLPGLHNGPADAFRHAYWNCLMTKSIGKDQAKTVGDTHEEFGKNHPNEEAMDRHNNEQGRSIKDTKKTDCYSFALDLLRNGKLVIIPNYVDVDTSGAAPQAPVASNSVPIPATTGKEKTYYK